MVNNGFGEQEQLEKEEEEEENKEIVKLGGPAEKKRRIGD